MIKGIGGALTPADEMQAEKLKRFSNFDMYEVDIKLNRNPHFHAKVFAFLNFCFAHWKGDREFMDESGQFDVFRNQLTCVAGFYNEYHKFDGSVRVEAKSLSYSNMTEDEFQECYSALINAAQKHIFKGCSEDTYNRLASFF